MKKVLFISSSSFSNETGGSVFFKKLIKEFQGYEFFWIYLTKSKKRGLPIEQIVELNLLNIFSILIIDKIFRKISFFGKLWFKYKYNYLYHLGKQNAHLLNNQFDLVWINPSTSSIPFSLGLLFDKKNSYHLTVHDDIYAHLPKFEAIVLEKYYELLLKNSATIDFASSALKDYTFKKYNFDSRCEIICFSDQMILPKPEVRKKVKFIGFAGNIWCAKNFEILLNFLERRNGTSDPIQLHIFSNNFPSKLEKKFKNIIVNHGILKNKDLLLQLQKMDLLYVPMSFSSNKKVVSSTSFPSKIFTYLNTGVPILFHAPSYSTVADFIKKYETGFIIQSIDQEKFDHEIINFVDNNYKMRSSISQNANYLLNNEFDFTNQTLRFFNLIKN